MFAFELWLSARRREKQSEHWSDAQLSRQLMEVEIGLSTDRPLPYPAKFTYHLTEILL